jgi:hypothetical protein
MSLWEWTAIVSGSALIVILLVDVLLTVLHLDIDGPITRVIHRSIWDIFVFFSRRFPLRRLGLLSHAGPCMTVATFFVWMGIYILGFALIYWVFLADFRADSEFEQLNFLSALYYSGITATVLGYGDISPLIPSMQILSFIQSGIGFALITAIVTFVLSLISGTSERNGLALSIWNETHQTGDGVAALTRSLSCEDISDVRDRLTIMVQSLHRLQTQMHHFPVLDLFYRSRNPSYDPDHMLRIFAELAIAAQIVAHEDHAHRLLPVARDLGQAVTQHFSIIAGQYMGRSVNKQLRQPAPGKAEYTLVNHMRTQLAGQLSMASMKGFTEPHQDTLDLAFQSRVFLNELDGLTAWRVARPANQSSAWWSQDGAA